MQAEYQNDAPQEEACVCEAFHRDSPCPAQPCVRLHCPTKEALPLLSGTEPVRYIENPKVHPFRRRKQGLLLPQPAPGRRPPTVQWITSQDGRNCSGRMCCQVHRKRRCEKLIRRRTGLPDSHAFPIVGKLLAAI